jgi:hypothetical protein
MGNRNGQSLRPSLTRLKQLLASCAFDPRKPGPMAAIVNAGDRHTWERRAVELVLEAQQEFESTGNRGFYHDQLTRAISLLALCKATVPEPGDEAVRTEAASGAGS